MTVFHRAFYAVMRFLVRPYFWLTGYRWERYDPKSPVYLVLTNHNTNWDFFLFGLVLKKQMYFVASDHILRPGFTGNLIRFLVDPIPRKKGSSSDETVKLIKERLAAGANVCMMAEGNRSFSGVTEFISPKTAELVKECGAGLVTLPIRGAYFVNPRWSKVKRKGATSGAVANEYTPEMLADMSVEEIYEAIKRDLYVDAYEDQAKKPSKYICKNPAESLETALFWCPSCKSIGSMSSQGNRFFCNNCGLQTVFTEECYLEQPEDNAALQQEGGAAGNQENGAAAEQTGSGAAGNYKLPFNTIRKWYVAQLDYMRELCEKTRQQLGKASCQPANGGAQQTEYAQTASGALFADDQERLYTIGADRGASLLGEGVLTLFGDRLEFESEGIPEGKLCFKIAEIEKISIRLTNTLMFTVAGKYYEIKSDKKGCCALKYLMASKLLAGKAYY